MWKKINFQTVFSEENTPSNNKELIRKYFKSIKTGGLEPKNLRKHLEENLDLEKIYSSEIDYGLVTVKYPKLNAINLSKKQIPKEKLIDYILASCTVFPFFKIQEIENNRYVDGGYKNPVPIDLAKSLGAEKLIIVNISIVGKNIKINQDEILS